ncbi:MAG: serine/threonine-protein kinase, partial [Myxococcota bacterium]|nr:serine/threonine-protein kinase [Myxococcota bacterium]
MIADGAVVDGKYRIIRCLGGGAMGKVYQAEKVTTHERFAVKFIHDYLLSDDVYLARFEREVNALRGIRHPHVVDVYDWKLPGKGAGGHGYIVMEYLDGESFQQVLQRPAGVSLGEVARVMLQVIDGLTAVHGLGIVHRDLSPANIFLVGRDAAWRSVKILDFGLAKGEAAASAGDTDGGVTQNGAVLGRAAYAAPEMFLGVDLDERADVFACGMIMYRALARRFPYRESKTDLIWVERYSERYEEGRPYPSARTFNPSIPAAMDHIISKAIRKRPSERYQKAVDMQADLVSAEAMLAKTPRVDSARPVEPEPPFDPAAGMTATRVDVPPPADGSPTPGAAYGGAMQSVSNWLRG